MKNVNKVLLIFIAQTSALFMMHEQAAVLNCRQTMQFYINIINVSCINTVKEALYMRDIMIISQLRHYYGTTILCIECHQTSLLLKDETTKFSLLMDEQVLHTVLHFQ